MVGTSNRVPSGLIPVFQPPVIAVTVTVEPPDTVEVVIEPQTVVAFVVETFLGALEVLVIGASGWLAQQWFPKRGG